MGLWVDYGQVHDKDGKTQAIDVFPFLFYTTISAVVTQIVPTEGMV
jgi:hypothetical protein